MLDINKLQETISELVDKAEGMSQRSGAEKKRLVIRQLAQKLDDLISFPATPIGKIAEAIDRPALMLLAHLLSSLVQGVFDKKKASAQTAAEPAKRRGKKAVGEEATLSEDT